MNRPNLITVVAAVSLALGIACKREKPVPMTCGGLANFVCPAHMYCKLKENCGGLDTEGTCKVRPHSCESKTERVCGCDGNTYSNECYAAVKGVSPRHSGGCEGNEDAEAEKETTTEVR